MAVPETTFAEARSAIFSNAVKLAPGNPLRDRRSHNFNQMASSTRRPRRFFRDGRQIPQLKWGWRPHALVKGAEFIIAVIKLLYIGT